MKFTLNNIESFQNILVHLFKVYIQSHVIVIIVGPTGWIQCRAYQNANLVNEQTTLTIARNLKNVILQKFNILQLRQPLYKIKTGKILLQ